MGSELNTAITGIAMPRAMSDQVISSARTKPKTAVKTKAASISPSVVPMCVHHSYWAAFSGANKAWNTASGEGTTNSLSPRTTIAACHSAISTAA